LTLNLFFKVRGSSRYVPLLELRRLSKVPEGSLIESHDHSRVIIVGFVFRVVVEQGHVPVSVVLKMQGVLPKQAVAQLLSPYL